MFISLHITGSFCFISWRNVIQSVNVLYSYSFMMGYMFNSYKMTLPVMAPAAWLCLRSVCFCSAPFFAAKDEYSKGIWLSLISTLIILWPLFIFSLYATSVYFLLFSLLQQRNLKQQGFLFLCRQPTFFWVDVCAFSSLILVFQKSARKHITVGFFSLWTFPCGM